MLVAMIDKATAEECNFLNTVDLLERLRLAMKDPRDRETVGRAMTGQIDTHLRHLPTALDTASLVMKRTHQTAAAAVASSFRDFVQDLRQGLEACTRP